MPNQKNSFPGFPPAALKFLRGLARHNDREWFEQRKPIYLESVKAPLVQLVEALNDEFETLAPQFRMDPKKSIYRIYRDVRFSPNKQPYKTNVAAIFHDSRLPKHSGAGFYLQFSPKQFFVGGGVYMPEPKHLLSIRRAIESDPGELRAVLRNRTLKRYYGEMRGEKLKRIPKGFSPDDPAADLLVYKQFLAMSEMDPKLVETAKMLPEIIKRFRALAPLIDFLNRPLTS